MTRVTQCHKCDGVGRSQEKVPMREEQKKRKEKEKNGEEAKSLRMGWRVRPGKRGL